MAAARDRGIYVSVMLFEGWGLQFSPGAWEGHPFNPKNNINGIDGDTNADGKGIEVHELGNKAVTEIQEAYIRKVIDTVNGFDNVLYEISNENHPPSTQWQYHMIRFIKEYERTKPQQHPVGMTFQYKGGENKTLFDSPADWVSPNPDGGYRDDPPPADGRKVVLNDTDHLWGIGGDLAWVWKSFTRGYNPIFMDPYDGDILGNRFDPQVGPGPAQPGLHAPVRSQDGPGEGTSEPGGGFDEILPRESRASSTWSTNRPSGGDSIVLEAQPGTYRYEWFDPASGKQVSAGTRTIAEGKSQFPCPVQGDAVLFVTKAVFPAKDWQQASPESQGMDSARLNAAADYLRENSGPDGVDQLVIIRNGCMVWKGSDIDKVHGVWSATKSFTSTVLGLLIDDERASLDTLAKDHVPAMAAAYPTVTLRHFTTMTSGYRAMKDEPQGGYRHGPSSMPFDPCETPLFTPGSQYAYWDSAMNQFGHVLTRIAGEPMGSLFKRESPNRSGWTRPTGIGAISARSMASPSTAARATPTATSSSPPGSSPAWGICSSIAATGTGGSSSARSGWTRRRSRRCLRRFRSGRTAAPTAEAPTASTGGPTALNADGQRKWPGAPAGTFAASGYNNNDMFVIPEWNMVIVRLGLDEGQRKITDAVYSSFIEQVGKAITDLPGM